MSQTGYTPIQLYRTTTSGAAPVAGNLSAGELAININDADMAIYAKNNSGTVKRIINNPAGLKYPTADGTSGQVISTDGAGNLTFSTASSGTITGSGTTNYHAKFTSSTALGNGVVYDDGTNVGIGTSSPTNKLSVAGGASTSVSAVTFSATAMTVNCQLANVFTTTFTANVTTAPTMSNPSDGQTINWFITQDGTGSRTMTWPTSFKWAGGTAGTLSTAANSVDLLVATYRSATGFWYASLSTGFA